MNEFFQLPVIAGIILFVLLQIIGYGLEVKGLKILAFYPNGNGFEMQASIVAIILPIVVGVIVYKRKRLNGNS